MDPAPTLDTLPNELLANVAQFTDKETLPALRLTSRHINAVVAKEFAIAFFTRVDVLLLPKAFRTLEQICRHRVFGHYVRSIYLCTARLSQEGYHDLVGSHASTISSCENRVLARKQRETYERSLEIQSGFIEEEEGVHSLTRALQHLIPFSRSMDVGIHDFIGAEGALGLATLCDIATPDALWTDRSTSLSILFAAVQRSGCPTHSLSVSLMERDRHGYWAPVHITYTDLSALTLGAELKTDAVRTICAGLRSIRLEYDIDVDAECLASLTSMRSLLSFAIHVESVQIEFTRSSNLELCGEFPYANFLDVLSSNSLRELRLIGVFAHEKSFMAALQKHRGTLRSLTLSLCDLEDDDRWSCILKMALSDLTLEQITLQSLYSWSSSCSIGLETNQVYCAEHRGTVAVRHALQEIIAVYETLENRFSNESEDS